MAIARITLGNSAKSILMVGLRGVGKTVLLEQMRFDAEQTGVHTIRIEALEGSSLPARLAPQFRLALLRLSRVRAAGALAQRGLRALAGFAKGLKFKYNDLEVGFDSEPEAGLADNGDLEGDLSTLLEQVGAAAHAAQTAVVLFIDEAQNIKRDEFAALISALHRCAQLRLPLTAFGAGLPQLRALSGNAKSYAERLFDFPEIGALTPSEAKLAIELPARDNGVVYTAEAIDEIVRVTHGYPYFLQEWGKHAWDVAQVSPITLEDVRDASREAIAALDESFFRVRIDRVTPSERLYLRAMAELGPGPHRSGEIAAVLGKPSSTLGPVRAGLIEKGALWSPNHGETAFTVPLFDEFMKRIMPHVEE